VYQKLPVLAILGAISPYLQSHNGEYWREGVTWDSLLHFNFERIAQGILPVLHCLGQVMHIYF